MKIKLGVILAGLRPEMRRALIVADKVWREHGQELVITSGLDSAHSAGSYHYYGGAIDCRTRYFDKDTLHSVYDILRFQLKDDYKVVLEATHIHVQLVNL